MRAKHARERTAFAVQLGALACRRAGKSNTRPGRFAYVERDQRDKERPGKLRGVNVARMDIARELTQAIWHTTHRSCADRRVWGS